MTHKRSWLLTTEGVQYYRGQELLLSTPPLRISGEGIIWVAGKNGAGKTLLLHLLSGRLLPSDGCVLFALQDSELQPVAESLFARQAVRLVNDHFSGDEQEQLGRYLYQLSMLFSQFDKKKAYQEYMQVVKVLGLQSLLKMKIRKLSLGQQRRVSMAQVLFGEAVCLFLDEPLTGLDREQEQRMVMLIKELAKERLVVISGHHLEALHSTIDYIYKLDRQNLQVLKPSVEVILTLEQELSDASV